MSKAESSPELDSLKERATKLGIKFSPNIGLSTLTGKINEAVINASQAPVKSTSYTETPEQKTVRRRKELMSLIRVKVTCFDPTMKKKAGTYIMGGNSVTGTIRKFIQFGKPWMMPRILVNIMQESEYQGWVDGKTAYGITKKISSIEPRYNVVELAPITAKELDVIKKRQQTTESLEDA